MTTATTTTTILDQQTVRAMMEALKATAAACDNKKYQ
jgi:hypothetical protein